MFVGICWDSTSGILCALVSCLMSEADFEVHRPSDCFRLSDKLQRAQNGSSTWPL